MNLKERLVSASVNPGPGVALEISTTATVVEEVTVGVDAICANAEAEPAAIIASDKHIFSAITLVLIFSASLGNNTNGITQDTAGHKAAFVLAVHFSCISRRDML